MQPVKTCGGGQRGIMGNAKFKVGDCVTCVLSDGTCRATVTGVMVYVDSTLYEVTDAGGTVNVVAEQFVSLA